MEIAKDKGLTQISLRNFNSGLNIDLGGWINNAKILVPVTEILRIPSQNSKLFKSIDIPCGNNIEVSYEDAPVIL